MKSYVLVILKTGSTTTTDQAFIDSCFRGHMNNINRLVEEGKLIVAGPLEKNDNSYRGIFIFNVKSIEDEVEFRVQIAHSYVNRTRRLARNPAWRSRRE